MAHVIPLQQPVIGLRGATAHGEDQSPEERQRVVSVRENGEGGGVWRAWLTGNKKGEGVRRTRVVAVISAPRQANGSRSWRRGSLTSPDAAMRGEEKKEDGEKRKEKKRQARYFSSLRSVYSVCQDSSGLARFANRIRAFC